MNKKKIIKKSSIFLGIASAIVTIPTVTSVVTANKTNSEQKTNNSLGNNYSGVSNYKNGGTKNNETMNFDDILNGASKASISNPVYAFDENNQLVVPNINESYYKDLQNTTSYVSDNLKSNYINDIISTVPSNNDKIDINSIKNTFNDGKQKSLEDSLSKFTNDQLNSVISLSDSQKKWINYLIPNVNINLDNNFVLRDFITQLTDNSFTEAQNGNLNAANIVNSLSAFGINLDEEKNKLESSIDDINSLTDILNNNGSFNNVLYGGGGVSSSGSTSYNPSNTNVDLPSTNSDSNSYENTTLKDLDGYLISLITLTSITIATSAAQIAIDIVLFSLSLWTNWYYIADSVMLGISIALAGIALHDYVSKRAIIDINSVIVFAASDGGGWILNKGFEHFFDKDIFKSIVNGDKNVKNYIQNLQKCVDSFNNKAALKVVSYTSYVKYLKLSIVNMILSWVNFAIDLLTTFLENLFNLIKSD